MRRLGRRRRISKSIGSLLYLGEGIFTTGMLFQVAIVFAWNRYRNPYFVVSSRFGRRSPANAFVRRKNAEEIVA